VALPNFIQNLIDQALSQLSGLFSRIFGGTIVGKLVDKITDGVSHILTLVDRINALVSSVITEVAAFRNWKEDVRVKSRVINVPKAIDRTADLVKEVEDAWTSIKDLAQSFKETVKGGGDPQAEAEEVAADLGDLSNVGESLLKKLPKLSRGLEKLLGVVSLIVEAVITWSSAVDDLQKIVDAVRDVRVEVETGDTLFLSQKNPRRVVQLEDGSSIKIRVGNLHS
jgi:methyl-accepting chemotaxis protein